MLVTKEEVNQVIDLMFTDESIKSGNILIRNGNVIHTNEGFDSHLCSNAFMIPNFVSDNFTDKQLFIFNKIRVSIDNYLQRFSPYFVYKFYEDYRIYVKRYRHGYVLSGITDDLCKNLKRCVSLSYVNMNKESDTIYKVVAHQYFINVYILSNYNPLTFQFTDKIVKDCMQYESIIDDLALNLSHLIV